MPGYSSANFCRAYSKVREWRKNTFPKTEKGFLSSPQGDRPKSRLIQRRKHEGLECPRYPRDVMPALCLGTVLMVHVLHHQSYSGLIVPTRGVVVRMNVGSKRREKANSSLRAVNTRRDIHPGNLHHCYLIASSTRIPNQYAPHLGQHCRSTDIRRILAAVQQRGLEKARQHFSACLLNTIHELHRPHPRPHRRIPRIQLQAYRKHDQHFEL